MAGTFTLPPPPAGPLSKVTRRTFLQTGAASVLTAASWSACLGPMSDRGRRCRDRWEGWDDITHVSASPRELLWLVRHRRVGCVPRPGGQEVRRRQDAHRLAAPWTWPGNSTPDVSTLTTRPGVAPGHAARQARSLPEAADATLFEARQMHVGGQEVAGSSPRWATRSNRTSSTERPSNWSTTVSSAR